MKFIQLSMKFILLINVKMPTIVGILTFISMINTTSEGLKAGAIVQPFIFSRAVEISYSVELRVEHEIFFMILEPDA